MNQEKFEKRVLDPKYPQKMKWFGLYPGIAFLFIGVCVAAFGFTTMIPEIRSVWDENRVLVKRIVPQTEGEKLLAEASQKYVEAAGTGWVKFAHEKTRASTMFFLFIGTFLISTYTREKGYRKLIEKLRAPNQAL